MGAARESRSQRCDRGNDLHAGPLETEVELTWLEGRIEHWIRFGHDCGETILDRRRRILRFKPYNIFAFVRWASNDFGTIVSRIDIVRAIDRGQPYQTLPIGPGGDSAANQRLAEGRARAAGDRRGGSAQDRCR